MNRAWVMLAAVSLAVWPAAPAWAGEQTGTRQSTRLYTAPDPDAGGGIRARVMRPDKPLRQGFAVPSENPRRVYQGRVSSGGTHIVFEGLPVARYDLMLLYDDEFYEGFTLTRQPDTLSESDRESIAAAIMKSVPFFDTKQIHRCQGVTGRGGRAMCVLQELRTGRILTQAATVMAGYQIRSIKLAMLEEVGPVGWQLARTREIVRTEVGPNDRKGLLGHRHSEQLSGIRVTDSVRDLGELRLE
jgi:hypothetical protein